LATSLRVTSVVSVRSAIHNSIRLNVTIVGAKQLGDNSLRQAFIANKPIKYRSSKCKHLRVSQMVTVKQDDLTRKLELLF
jgi:hypothetical protein